MAILPNTLNLNNLTVDPATGRVSFSGLGTGIDWQGAIRGIIAARQAPIDTLSQKITANEAKIAALQDMRAHVTTLKNAISALTARAPASLIGASVSNAAEAGIHTLEIRRSATAHKIGSGTFAAKNAAL